MLVLKKYGRKKFAKNKKFRSRTYIRATWQFHYNKKLVIVFLFYNGSNKPKLLYCINQFASVHKQFKKIL